TAGNTVTFDGVRFSDGVDLSLIGLEGIPEAREISTSASTAVLRGLGGKVGQGKGGNLRIKTGSLFVTNGAFLSTLTLGEGDRADAGNIIIRAKDLVFLDGNSRISGVVAAVIPAEDGKNLRFEVTGDGGDIDIQARSLFLKDSAGLNTSTLSSGKAGDILLDIAESVTISGVAVIEDDDNNKNFSPTGLFSETNTLKATGEGGKIDINTGILRISDGAVLSASSESVAKAGDVIVNVNELELTGGGEIFTTAFNTGVAGNITINATDKITISGTQFTRFEMPSGGLFANSNSPQATKAGNINVKALVVLMDNQGKISTETSSGDGGNINLQLGELLLLRNNSQISTTAGTAQAGGDGGNISINSPFIVALPNEDSDITANAFAGRGGNVDIITQGIFGIQPRSQTTLQSDITASSQRSIQGEISVTEPEIDPSQGLLELPSGVIDKSDQIAQICPRGINAKKLSEFYITGKGSLPPSPLDMLTGTVELSRLASLDGESVRGGRGATALGGFPDLKQVAGGRGGRGGRIYKESQEIVEAQGFMKAENGEIYLVAQAPSAAPSATISKSACVEAAQK
ncbi:MAG: S-layer family protein, partial [Cyanobacteria bacterium J06649_11]